MIRHMKRAIFVLSFILLSISAGAQIRFGGSFNVNIDTENTKRNSGTENNKENSFIISLNPKIYWNLSEKVRTGFRVGFAYGTMAASALLTTEDISASEDSEAYINRALGWSFSPFFGYKLLSWNFIGIWVEANAIAGQLYNVGAKTFPELEWNKSTQYGVQIVPVIDFDITETLSLQLHLGILSLGYMGETSIYDNKTVSRNVWDFRKGGFDGLIQGLYDYGIGIVKKF